MSTVDESIVPDDKDWTWVLQEPCAECGFRAEDVDPRGVADLVRACLPRWQQVLARPDAAARRRPDVWSDLEYACHVRDVLVLFAERLRLMLTADEGEARFANWDQDATAVEQRYAEQDPAVVARELTAAGEHLAAAFDAVPADAWGRVGLRSDGSVFTVETFAQYFWHDVAHHLVDVDG